MEKIPRLLLNDSGLVFTSVFYILGNGFAFNDAKFHTIRALVLTI